MNHSSSLYQTPLTLARKKRGWTQAYVAEQVDVSIDAVRRWESGRLPYPNSIQKLCLLFASSPKELGFFSEPGSALSSGIWEADDWEKQAAWEIYIELITRVPLAPLKEDWGILREALSSLYSLFQTTRTVLRHLNPGKSRSDREHTQSFSYLAVKMLNTVLRPLLSKWHPLLKDYEEKRPVSMGVLEYERQWERYSDLRQEIVTLQQSLLAYADAFAKIAGTPSMIAETDMEKKDGLPSF